MRIEKSVEIERPREEVFALIRDPDNDPAWCPSVLSSEQVAGDGPAVGAEYAQVHKPGPKASDLHVEITAMSPPESMRIRSTDELAVFEVSYGLEELAGGRTRLTQTDEISFRGPGRLLAPVILLGVQAGVRRQFKALKEMLEARAEPTGESAVPEG